MIIKFTFIILCFMLIVRAAMAQSFLAELDIKHLAATPLGETSGIKVYISKSQYITSAHLKKIAKKYADQKSPGSLSDKELIELLASNSQHLRYAAFACLAERHKEVMRQIQFFPLQKPECKKNKKAIAEIKLLLRIE